MPRPGRQKVGEILVHAGLINQDQLKQALDLQKQSGERIGRILVKLGFATEDDILQVLETQLGIPKVRLSEYVVSQETLKLVPENLARRYKVIPLEVSGGKLVLAMADPLNIFAVDDIRISTGMEVMPVVASESEIQKAFSQYYSGVEGLDDVLRDLAANVAIGEEEEDVDIGRLRELVDEAPVVRLVNAIITQAIRERASDIHVQPEEKTLRVRFRVDGMLRDIPSPPPKASQSAIISRLKIMANMDIAERRVPQDGRVHLKVEGEEVDLRVSTLPTLFGEKVVARILVNRKARTRFEELGFLPETLEKMKAILEHPYGIFLVTGPTGSGKTQTLYAGLNYLNSPEKNIVTVEDPVEFRLPGINQVQTNPKAGLTFAVGLRAILRQDPDIVMVGEIRDAETATIALQAAMTGHLVLSTLHTNDAASALTRLVDMGMEPYLVASSVIGVVAQRLVRTICPQCKEEATVSEEVWRHWRRVTGSLGSQFDSDVPPKLFRGKGCSQCGGTGYYGRTAIHEIMIMNSTLRDLVVRNASADELNAAAMRAGMKKLIQDGAEKVKQGITTLEEVMRVATGGDI